MIGSSIAVNIRRSHDLMSRGVAVTSDVAGDSCATGATRFYGFDDTESHRIGDRPAHGAGNPAILAGRFPTVLHRPSLEPYPGAGRRCRPCTRQAHRHPGAARHGAGGQTRLRPLPRSAQPGTLGRPRRGASIVAPSPGGAVAQRRGGDRHRRYHRAALGRQNQGTRHLSRRGALVARPLCQDQRFALAVAGSDVAGPVRRQAVGFAIPDCAGTVGALERGAGEAAQGPDRLGEAGDTANQTLAAGSPRGCRRRQPGCVSTPVCSSRHPNAERAKWDGPH
jgi:hypothetical protein